MEKVVSLKSVFYRYEENLVLEDVNLDILENDFLAVIGPNGGGKTTLLKLILGLLTPQKGVVKLFGKGVKKARSNLGYVPQYSVHQKDFPISSFEVILEGLLKPVSFFPWFSKKDRNKALEIMDFLSIVDLKDQNFGSLSGGQKQRVLIARALVANPKLLLLDEPTASVDPRAEQEIYDILKALNKDISIVLVSHNVDFISSYVNKVACLNHKLVVHASSEVCKDQLNPLYDYPVKKIEHSCFL